MSSIDLQQTLGQDQAQFDANFRLPCATCDAGKDGWHRPKNVRAFQTGISFFSSDPHSRHTKIVVVSKPVERDKKFLGT